MATDSPREAIDLLAGRVLGYGVVAAAGTLAPVAALSYYRPTLGVVAFVLVGLVAAAGTMLYVTRGVGRAGRRPPLPVEERHLADPPTDHDRRMRRIIYFGGLAVGALVGAVATGFLWL